MWSPDRAKQLARIKQERRLPARIEAEACVRKFVREFEGVRSMREACDAFSVIAGSPVISRPDIYGVGDLPPFAWHVVYIFEAECLAFTYQGSLVGHFAWGTLGSAQAKWHRVHP